MHLLESADEWPFLKAVIAHEGASEAAEGQQEHLLCDALVGEPFYYRVRTILQLSPRPIRLRTTKW